MSLIKIENITKSYVMGDQSLTVLKGVSLTVEAGEFLAIIGQSGSGKSTLMNMVGLLDEPTSGKYFFRGEDSTKFFDYERTKIRGEEVGFVFQSYNLIPRLDVFRQVSLPLTYQGKSKKEIYDRVLAVLTEVGLADKMHHTPNQLSGGQQQRISIARALVSDPSLILADEPTGALDSNTGKEIMDLFRKLNAEGKTIIMITHDNKLAQQANRQVKILDGEII